MPCIGASSNGRTRDFGSLYHGSNPCAPTKIKKAPVWVIFFILYGTLSVLGHTTKLFGSGRSEAKGTRHEVLGITIRALQPEKLLLITIFFEFILYCITWG